MSADAGRSVRDRPSLLACFDETSTPVFAALCRLTAGDSQRAAELLVETYRYLERAVARAADPAGGIVVDASWMLLAAHSVYAATAGVPGAGETPPVAALTPHERVAVSLHLVERRAVADVAQLLDTSVAAIDAALASATARLTAFTSTAGVGPGDSSAADVMRRCEVWFDDTTRADVRSCVLTGEALPRRSMAAAVTAAAPLPSISAVRASGGRGTDGFEPFRAEPELARTRRSRGVIAGGLIAAAAVIGALAVWVMPSDPDDPAAGSPTSTTRPSINGPTTTDADTTDSGDTSDATVPATDDTLETNDTNDTGGGTDGTADPDGGDSTDTTDPETVEIIHTPGFVLDPAPVGFIGVAADVGRRTTDAPNWFELWSSPDATRSGGRWLTVLVVDAEERRPSTGIQPGSRRVMPGGEQGLITTTPDGVTRLTVGIDDGPMVEFQSFGVSEDALVALATSTTFDDANRPDYGDAGRLAFDGTELRIGRATSGQTSDFQQAAWLGDGSRAVYQSEDGSEFLSVITGPQVENDLLLATLLSPASTDPAAPAAGERTVTVRDRTMYVGQLPTGRPTASSPEVFQYVEWHEDDHTILIVGITGLDTVLEAAGSARTATVEEWQALIDAPPTGLDDSIDDDGTKATTIGGGATDNGVTFSLALAAPSGTGAATLTAHEERPVDLDSTTSATSTTATSFLSIAFTAEQPVVALHSIDATVLVVAFATPPDAVAVRFIVDGEAPVDVPLVPLEDSEWYAAAHAFSEYADATIALVDATGEIVALLEGAP